MVKDNSQTKNQKDRRLKTVERTMNAYGNKPHALIETLHAVQESYGFIGQEMMEYVADRLGVSLSKVYGVVTFYHFFILKPQGEHVCVVCTGTACYIGGANAIIDEITKSYEIIQGETTKDNKLSLVTARCLGACGIAPVVVYDGEVAGKQNARSAIQRIGGWLKNES